jgi:hypothetical protein
LAARQDAAWFPQVRRPELPVARALAELPVVAPRASQTARQSWLPESQAQLVVPVAESALALRVRLRLPVLQLATARRFPRGARWSAQLSSLAGQPRELARRPDELVVLVWLSWLPRQLPLQRQAAGNACARVRRARRQSSSSVFSFL